MLLNIPQSIGDPTQGRIDLVQNVNGMEVEKAQRSYQVSPASHTGTDPYVLGNKYKAGQGLCLPECPPCQGIRNEWGEVGRRADKVGIKEGGI